MRRRGLENGCVYVCSVLGSALSQVRPRSPLSAKLIMTFFVSWSASVSNFECLGMQVFRSATVSKCIRFSPLHRKLKLRVICRSSIILGCVFIFCILRLCCWNVRRAKFKLRRVGCVEVQCTSTPRLPSNSSRPDFHFTITRFRLQLLVLKIDWPLRVLRPIAALCEMRPLCYDQAMCERKAKKDAPPAVVSRAACVSRAPPADASRLALSGWGRPAWSLRVILLLTMFR